MRHHWQAFLELIWSSRYDPVASRERRIAWLQMFLAMAIALAAGPEIFLAMEMTAVMELLGALLFLTAMAAGAKLAVLNIGDTLRAIALPIPLPVIVRSDASLPAKAMAFAYVAAHATFCVAMALNCRSVASKSL
jgi:hypothetical protein